TTVKFSAETQVCDAEKCLPPDWQDFSVKITPKVPEKEDVTENNTEEKKEENPETPVVTVTEEIQDSLNIVQNELNESKDSLSITSNNNIETAIPIEKDSKENKGLWEIFILGVGGGLLALVMPCIFPMIPL